MQMFLDLPRSKIPAYNTIPMVGPRDGGFGFDGGKKYSNFENVESICVQCQAGQHAKCLAKSDDEVSCDCEICMLG